VALAIASLSSAALFWVGAWRTHSSAFAYLLWNLFLAWVPFGLTLWLVRLLGHKLWSSWQTLIITLLWLGFLPNTFYLISDLTHLQDMPHADLMYDVVMFTSFVLNGVILGCLSVYLVHLELAKRVNRHVAGSTIGVILLLCSFAIYLGHNLRWNTWDVLLNPGGLLVGVSDPVLHPWANSRAFTVTFAFFVLLGSLYYIVWQMGRVARQQKA